MQQLLFYDGELRASLEAQARRMTAAVDGEPEESVKQADVEAWAAALAHHFAVVCPELKPDEVWMEPPRDIGVDVSRDWQRAIIDPDSDAVRNFPGYRSVIHVPFEGDSGVFSLKPGTWSTLFPRGDLGESELLFIIDHPHDQQPNIDGEARGFINLVEKFLGYARSDIDAFNANLEMQARQAIEKRRQRLERRDANLAQSGIPIRHPGESGKKTYIADVLVRRPAPTLPKTRADDRPPKLEPALEQRVFEHVLGVIRKQCLHIEQNPRTYVPMVNSAQAMACTSLGSITSATSGMPTTPMRLSFVDALTPFARSACPR